MNEMVKNFLFWLIIVVVFIVVFQSFNFYGGVLFDLFYSVFVQNVDNGNVFNVNISVEILVMISGKFKDGISFCMVVFVLGFFINIVIKQMQDKGVEVCQDLVFGFLLVSLLVSWLLVILIVGVFIWFMCQMQFGGGGCGVMSFG